ncbi:MAG TPA: patatin-like protein [Alphaproteobacteria bacterium]|nr:patatin-like protein [Alphaproteobacteria bacterium]
MREKELRLALVFFGGISLAVYMHGISKEVLKLVRASKALHAIANRAERLVAAYPAEVVPPDGECDTEGLYFELLREIGRKVELRVIVDVIAGASAGGINGVMLARALAHDLPMERLRELWLAEADVSELLAREAKAKAWSKWFLLPFLWGAGRTRLLANIPEREVRRKLSLFLRSRWFKPPFDGLRMSELMLDAVRIMGEGEGSLLPSGMRLELFVALTDFSGYQQLIQIHDPPLIREREHRHILRFGYRRSAAGKIKSDFTLADAAALAFAARGTSSFPGAFPPARIVEMDALLESKGLEWPNRARFLARNFERYYRAGTDPELASFIDGSVLTNKPFSEAIQSIRGRPAYRQVDRRLVYVEPDPVMPPAFAGSHPPGFFTALKGALSDLPRHEPIAQELNWVNGFNERVRRLQAVVEAARPEISGLVAGVATAAIDRPLTIEQIASWREAVNLRVRASAGFAYEAYVRLKMSSARGFVAELMALACDFPTGSLAARAVSEIVDAWTRERGIVYGEGESAALKRERVPQNAVPPWVAFLLSFDVAYRMRRLSFLIQGQNRLYAMCDEAGLGSDTAQFVDRLKRQLYQCLEVLRGYETAEFLAEETRAAARELFATPPSTADARDIEDYARDFASRHGQAIAALVERIAREIDLAKATHDVDALLAGMDHGTSAPLVRREVLTNYLGFPFWDVLTFSVTNWRDVGEFGEIRIDRISPEDVRFRGKAVGPAPLKGTSLAHFGAFFSRAYRENDYLLGRLHAVERLIEIVCDAAGSERYAGLVDMEALKRRAFARILEAEEKHLPASRELIATLRRELLEAREQDSR